jgi:hypothetical protein
MAAPVSVIRWILIMASGGWADAVPGKTRSRLAPASSWTDFDAERAASPRTAGLGPATRFAGTPPPEAMTMRFYTGQHRFYCGVLPRTSTSIPADGTE